jgi:hypothetical protein
VSGTHIQNLKYTNLRWSSAEQLDTHASDTTIPAQLLISSLFVLLLRDILWLFLFAVHDGEVYSQILLGLV